MDHAAPFFNSLQLSTSPKDFETKRLHDGSVPASFSSLFQEKDFAIQHERVMQVLHIIRNLTFMHENAAAFSKDIKLLTILAKGMSLPIESYCNTCACNI